jgi:hypothetical protein
VSLELVVSVMGDNGHILCCSRNDGSLVQYPGVVPAEQRRYSLYCPAIHGVFFGGRYWDADFEEGTSNMSQKQKKKSTLYLAKQATRFRVRSFYCGRHCRPKVIITRIQRTNCFKYAGLNETQNQDDKCTTTTRFEGDPCDASGASE